ncbi:MAG: hypothetical protein WC861_05215 [Candidatus Micrarchaeia archaeon]|jgi:hypothetical protein
MNVVANANGKRALMPEEQGKWSNFPVGAAFPPNGAWKGQPRLFAKGGPNFEMSAKDRAAFQAFFDKQGKRPEVREAAEKALQEMKDKRGKWPWLDELAKSQEHKPFPGEPTV